MDLAQACADMTALDCVWNDTDDRPMPPKKFGVAGNTEGGGAYQEYNHYL